MFDVPGKVQQGKKINPTPSKTPSYLLGRVLASGRQRESPKSQKWCRQIASVVQLNSLKPKDEEKQQNLTFRKPESGKCFTILLQKGLKRRSGYRTFKLSYHHPNDATIQHLGSWSHQPQWANKHAACLLCHDETVLVIGCLEACRTHARVGQTFVEADLKTKQVSFWNWNRNTFNTRRSYWDKTNINCSSPGYRVNSGLSHKNWPRPTRCCRSGTIWKLPLLSRARLLPLPPSPVIPVPYRPKLPHQLWRVILSGLVFV